MACAAAMPHEAHSDWDLPRYALFLAPQAAVMIRQS
jgi:hypothetical protein